MMTQIVLWVLAVVILVGIVVCIVQKKYQYAIALGFLEIVIVLYNNLFVLK